MIDIHSHILWGLDDGAKNEEISTEMLEIAKKETIEHIIVTPHFMVGHNTYDQSLLAARMQEVQQKIDQNGWSIQLHMGQELFLDPDLEELWEKGAYASLANSNYLLIEFPMSQIPSYTKDVLYRLQLKGLIPIIAHPERYREIQKDPNQLYEFLERGCFAQINTSSMTGIFGEKVAQTAKILWEHNMVHFVGSDAHTNTKRAPRFLQSYELATQWVGSEKTQQVFEKNGKYILQNQLLPFSSPKNYQPKKKSFFHITLQKLLNA